MAELWVKVVRGDGSGTGNNVYVNGQYADAAGFVATSFKSETGTNTFETLGVNRKPNWRRRKRIEAQPGDDNSKENPILVTLDPVEPSP